MLLIYMTIHILIDFSFDIEDTWYMKCFLFHTFMKAFVKIQFDKWKFLFYTVLYEYQPLIISYSIMLKKEY